MQNNSNAETGPNAVRDERNVAAMSLPAEAETEIASEIELSFPNEPDYVVGIGASAGGLEALEELFETMPIDTDMAFVIIQHLSPDHKSLMDELLSRKTPIPVRVAEDGMIIEKNHIYLLPPNREMIAANNRLYLTERQKDSLVNLPINTFLRSMSETYQERGIAIILSGTGSDGSKGIVPVHDNGGFVISQDPSTCKFDSMPNRAIETNKVDLTLPPRAIPNALYNYTRRTLTVHNQQNMSDLDAEESQFSEILILLNNRFDLDFSQYKPSTITRRLERRLVARKVKSLNEYLTLLLSNADELEALYYDLLIGVTEFFRDKKAFASLRSSIALLLSELPPDEEFRVWSLGCATGQEAYSLSILINEEIAKSNSPNRRYKIFATDIHRKSIARASAGNYRPDEMDGLTEEQVTKFFTQSPNGAFFQVSPDIRTPILFAPQNILKDPPFTRLHLATCRNVLIYFSAQAQQRVLSLLTFSLLHKGLLFLGPSESLGNHSADFQPIDPKNRLMRKVRDGKSRHNFDLRPIRSPRTLPSKMPAVADGVLPTAKSSKALEVLLQKYVPASVLLNTEGSILHFFGDAGKFLALDAGVASLNIKAMVTGRAKSTLTHMLQHVNKSHTPATSKRVSGFSGFELVDVSLRPLSDAPGDMDYILASFSEHETAEPVEEQHDVLTTTQDVARVHALEEELAHVHENLQATVEELQSSNEELQASNEELQASNEELQSTNEELQSVNEELYSVNAEYLTKEHERRAQEADEASIFKLQGMGVMFLTADLRVRKCSSIAASAFGIIEGDIDRPVSAISSNTLRQILDAISNINNGESNFFECELTTEENIVYSVRVSDHTEPLTHNDDAEGSGAETRRTAVVVTLSEVTTLSQKFTNSRKNETRLQNILDAAGDGYFEWDLNEKKVFINDALIRSLGYEEEKPSWPELLGDQFKVFERKLAAIGSSGDPLDQVLALKRADGSLSWKICRGRIVRDWPLKQNIFSGLAIDFDEHKNMEKTLNAQAADLERSNTQLEKFAYIVSHDLKAPLRHIQVSLEFLGEDLEAGNFDSTSELISEIQSNVDRQHRLIDDIITYSRVTSEPTALETIDLGGVLDAALIPLERIIEENNITLTRSKLPKIEGDKTLITQLFQNLVGNACKYTDKPHPKVSISHKKKGSNYVISIQDDGIGFDAKHCDSMFEPFKRLVTQAEFEGTGIGLSICKTVVEQHRGKISVTSKPGTGSTFNVTLPIKQKG